MKTTIVSVSLDSDVRDALVAEAERQRRSRSFVVREALREYVARRDRVAFTDARDQTLREGLALPPAERVKLSEELWEELAGKQEGKPEARSFDTFDEYERWRRDRVA
jgi:predicted transcriptional regulator